MFEKFWLMLKLALLCRIVYLGQWCQPWGMCSLSLTHAFLWRNVLLSPVLYFSLLFSSHFSKKCRGEGGTVDRIKYLAFSWKYMSLHLYFESGTTAQQLSSTFPSFYYLLWCRRSDKCWIVRKVIFWISTSKRFMSALYL
jgi:hypothetical protein